MTIAVDLGRKATKQTNKQMGFTRLGDIDSTNLSYIHIICCIFSSDLQFVKRSLTVGETTSGLE